MGSLVSTLAFPVPDRTYALPLLERQQRQHPNRLVWLTLPDGLKTPALYIVRNSSAVAFTILYSHGNAEDVGILVPYLLTLSKQLRVNILAYEYPGYGVSEAKHPSENGCYQAIQAAYSFLTQDQQINPSQIILMGRSLGTGPTVHLAAALSELCKDEDRPQGMFAGTILQSPLESGIRCVMGSCSSIALYPVDIFRSYAKVSSIRGPVLIVHGEADRVVPCSNGKALYALLQERPNHVPYDPVWIANHGHNDMPLQHCREIYQDFIFFLKSRSTIRY